MSKDNTENLESNRLKNSRKATVCKFRRWFLTILSLSVIALAVISFPSYWGPWLAERVILYLLPSSESYENRLEVKCTSLSAFEISNIELKGIPMAPSCSSVKVRYSLSGLIRRHIESVKICDLSVDPSWELDDFSIPPSGGVATGKNKPTPQSDPLMGWSLGNLSIKTKEIDLRPILPTQVLPLLTNTCVSASLSASMGEKHGEAIFLGGALGGAIDAKLKYSRVASAGSFTLAYEPSLPSSLSTNLGALAVESSFSLLTTNGISALISGKIGFTECNWRGKFSSHLGMPLSNIKVELPETLISDLDPLMQTALAFIILPDIITDLHFGGNVKANFNATFGGEREPRWRLLGGIKDGYLNLNASEIPISLEGARSSFNIEGIADLWRLGAIPVSISNAKISSFELNKGRAFLRADDKSLMASEIAIGFCGGSIRLYALYFNFAKLNTGFTVVLDSLDAGELIQQLPNLNDATATGTLHGRLPLSITKEGEFRLRDGFIYSPPGETGNISIKNPEYIISTLSSAGLPTPVCENFGKALQNLNYDILRFDLSQPRHANGRMQVRLKGESPSGKVSTPVDLNININGPIEELLNLAVKTAKIKDR